MKNKMKFFRIFLFLVCLLVFFFSCWQIFLYLKDVNVAKNQNGKIIENVIIPLSPGMSFSENSSVKDETVSDSMYPDITVDLEKLKLSYPDATGWLYCPSTPIHYPVMQSADNDYYLSRLPDGKKNPAGSLFVDCRFSSDFSGFGQIIYGHNMKNDTMFGTLLDYRNEDYFKNHPFLFYFTDSGIFRVELFAGVHTTSDSDFYVLPEEENERNQYVKNAVKRSVFSSDIKVSGEDKILVLSTCSGNANEKKRFALMGKLVLIQDKSGQF